MFTQGSFSSQAGQGPQKPRPPPFVQNQLPPLPHNFQQPPLLPSPQVPPRPALPGLPIYQHDPIPPHFGLRHVLPGGRPNPGQHFSFLPPTVHGSAPLPHMQAAAQQNSRHPYLAPQPPPPRSLPPAPSQSPALYRAPILQPHLQQTGVQGLQKMISPQPPVPTCSIPTSGLSRSVPESTIEVSKTSSVPPQLPRPPSLPSSQPPPVSGSSPPPKPAEDVVQRIEEFCQLIAKNGSSYEDTACQKESENPLFNFLFGGEPRSEAAIANEYYLWMKKKCETEGTGNAMPTNHLTVAAEPHSLVDSDMEMEDDITGHEIDQDVNQPFNGPTQAIVSRSSKDAEKQLHTLPVSEESTSVVSDAVNTKLHTSLSGMYQQEQKLVSCRDEVASESSGSENSSTHLADNKSSSMGVEGFECTSSHESPGRVTNGGSPIRLLQDYASTDSSENDEDSCLKDADPEIVSPNRKVNRSKSPNGTVGLHSNSGFSCRSSEFFLDSQNKVKEIDATSIPIGLTTKNIDAKQNQLCVESTANPKALYDKDASGVEFTNAALSNEHDNDNEDKTANTQKIDKFGRLVRERASDSDSDDSSDTWRHGKRRRSRSRSHSRSPIDRRRGRRRNPRRRREYRIRSPSWSPRRRRSRSRSPRNRRSRSRSPSFRHASEFSSGSIRRERGQKQACFDFSRGRCYRGASCRYLHLDSEKNEGSRHRQSKKQIMQAPSRSKNSNIREGTKKLLQKLSDCEQEMKCSHDARDSSVPAAQGNVFLREVSISPPLVNSGRINSGKVVETEVVQGGPENLPGVIGSDQPTVADAFPSKHDSDAKTIESYGEASEIVLPSQSRLALSHPALEDTYQPDEQTYDSSISDSSPDKISTVSMRKLNTSEPLPTSVDLLHDPPPLLHFPPAPTVVNNNTTCVTQVPMDYNLMPQTEASQSQSAPLKTFPSYGLPSQSSIFRVPLNPSSISLPPPPPSPAHVLPVNAAAGQPVSSQFQQSCMPPRNNFASQMFSRPPYPTDLHGSYQLGALQHQASCPVKEPHQPIQDAVDYTLKPQPGSNPSGRQFSGASVFGEDRIKKIPMQSLSASDSYTGSTSYPPSLSFSQEVPAIRMQSFAAEGLIPGEMSKPSSQIHPYMQQQHQGHVIHHSLPDPVYDMPGKVSSSRLPPGREDRNKSLHLPDFGVARIPAYFNPYASTFEKPLSSRFSSDAFRRESDATYASKHGDHFGLSHSSVEAQGGESRQANPSPSSGRGGRKIIPGSSGDQYDPLFDSIEPSSNSHKKSDHVQKSESPGDYNIMPGLTGLDQTFDVEENNRKKESSRITPATSLDNQEFGETADAEVGDVENGSHSSPDALANTKMGEMEIDRIKSPGKSRNDKESRSMKLFRACLADFVKEVLKPSWRQGNMSKETFKTVVKKTVDKVAGAMKNRRMPKSKAKINQYIDSSQKKLTKLVMGYVDKYAKG